MNIVRTIAVTIAIFFSIGASGCTATQSTSQLHSSSSTVIIADNPGTSGCGQTGDTDSSLPEAVPASSLLRGNYANSTTHIGEVGSGSTIHVYGDGSSVIVSGNVESNSTVYSEGDEGCITINGDVGEGSFVVVNGSNAVIVVNGNVAPSAIICTMGDNNASVQVNGAVYYESFRSGRSDMTVRTGDNNWIAKPAQQADCRQLLPPAALRY